MPGTSKEHFLVVAQFMYPMAPLPKVSWDNLEVLLVEGRKWSKPVRWLSRQCYLNTRGACSGISTCWCDGFKYCGGHCHIHSFCVFSRW
jgi:hypothetical protein